MTQRHETQAWNYVVIMFEPALPGETLRLSEQVNEVFGPMTETEADAWMERAEQLYEGKNRKWLISPLSDPAALNLVDPLTN